MYTVYYSPYLVETVNQHVYNRNLDRNYRCRNHISFMPKQQRSWNALWQKLGVVRYECNNVCFLQLLVFIVMNSLIHCLQRTPSSAGVCGLKNFHSISSYIPDVFSVSDLSTASTLVSTITVSLILTRVVVTCSSVCTCRNSECITTGISSYCVWL